MALDNVNVCLLSLQMTAALGIVQIIVQGMEFALSSIPNLDASVTTAG